MLTYKFYFSSISSMSFDWQSGKFESGNHHSFNSENRISHYFQQIDFQQIENEPLASNALKDAKFPQSKAKNRFGIETIIECLNRYDVETAMYEGLSYYQTYVKMCHVHHKSEVELLTQICKLALVLGDKVTASTVSEYLEEVLPVPKRNLGFEYVHSFFTVSRAHARNYNVMGERRCLGAVIASYDEFKTLEMCYAAESMLLLALNFCRETREVESENNLSIARDLLKDCLNLSQRTPVGEEIQQEASELMYRIDLGLL